MNKLLILGIVFIFVILGIYADNNGVWHFAEDVKPGIFGQDEDGDNSSLNYTFITKVFFLENILLKVM